MAPSPERSMRENWNSNRPGQPLLFWLPVWLLLCGVSSGSASDPQDEARVIDGLQKSYDSAVDFVADFRQETELKTLARSLKAHGKLYFKRPGRMLWRYDEPKGQFVLADGKNLYYYQPEQGQVLKSPLKSAFRSDIPLSFLLGIGNLKKEFKVSLKGLEQGFYLLRLEPRGELGGFGEILLSVDAESFNIRSSRIRDAAGNVTMIRFASMRKGAGLKDSLFRLQLPEGVDVVELGAQSR